MFSTWKKKSLFWALALTVVLSTAGVALAAKGGKKPPKEDSLPAVRYRIKFPALPPNATRGAFVVEINNLGQVVGYYSVEEPAHPHAFLYDPMIDPDQAFDLNAIVTGGLPEGWRLRWARSINESMVVVGNMEEIGSDPVQRRAFAVDLAANNPVVDLLPDVGADYSAAWQINENGDILGAYQTAEGDWVGWLFNPGLYAGDPVIRAARDGIPLDMSDDIPTLLPLSGNARWFQLNNPVGNSPAQIAGATPEGIAFRYTTGETPVLETFPELDLYSTSNYTPYLMGLNDAGTFCSTMWYNWRGSKFSPFRFNDFPDGPDIITDAKGNDARDINSTGDLLLNANYRSGKIYRDDWGVVAINDLVVGSDADLALWFSSNWIDTLHMNDRAGPTDAAQITGRKGLPDYAGQILFVLTPEPAP